MLDDRQTHFLLLKNLYHTYRESEKEEHSSKLKAFKSSKSAAKWPAKVNIPAVDSRKIGKLKLGSE